MKWNDLLYYNNKSLLFNFTNGLKTSSRLVRWVRWIVAAHHYYRHSVVAATIAATIAETIAETIAAMIAAMIAELASYPPLAL